MGIVRLLFYVAIGWVLYKLVKGLVTPRKGLGPQQTPSDRARLDGGELVQDPHCGVYIPRQGAVRGSDGECFCSEECREAHRKRDA